MFDVLPDVVAYLTCLLAAVVAGGRLVRERGAPDNPVLRYLCLLGLFLGLSVGLQAPASLAVIDRIHTMFSLADWAGDQLTLVALSFLALVSRAVTAAGGDRPARPYLVLAGAVLASMTVLLALAHAHEAGETFLVGGAGRWFMVGYKSLFLAYGTWCLLVFIQQLGRHAAQVEPGAVRSGLLLFVAAGSVGLLWTGWTVSDIQSIVTSGVIDAAEDPVTAVLGATCLSLGAAGITVATWGRVLRASRRWWWAYRGYRRISPLWTAMYRAFPEIALARLGAGVPRDAEFALYRRVIEIHDGQLALRAYCHPRAAGWAAEAVTESSVLATARAATMQAAVIAAALEAAAAGHRFAPADPAGPVFAPAGSGADVDAETAWLGRVAEAFTGSSVVASVRARVRAELATTNG